MIKIGERPHTGHLTPKHGPELTDAGVDYHLWSPDAKFVSVLIGDGEPAKGRRMELNSQPGGWFTGLDEAGQAGDLYEFVLDYQTALPDVASRFQPHGIRGRSQVTAPYDLAGNTNEHVKINANELVIYELHIGTFSETGTFAGAINHLDHLKQLGVTAIQLMPIAAFPGNRNWGYDVVLPFAPANAYGTPDDLRRLIAAAHQHNLAVIIDVVYNHVCGEPNYLRETSRHYFKAESGNAWGSSLNFDGEHSEGVRAFFKENAVYWLDEFGADGLRLDATHAIVDTSPVHILQEITDAVHQRGGFVIAEDDRNDSKLLRPTIQGGLGMDAVWADDFHHVLKMTLKPEAVGHFKSYQGTPGEMADTLKNGWLFRGQYFSQWKHSRGTECRECSPAQFVYCISNHDQAGNRPLGERLNQLVSPAAYRAASMFFLLLPYTPMLFMGQEWAASTPFCFFTNHSGAFGGQVSEGRLKEFKNFGSEWPAAMLAAMPDPEKFETFSGNRVNWEERRESVHQVVFDLYRECLHLRKRDPVLRLRDRTNWETWAERNILFVRYGASHGPARLLVAKLANDTKDGASSPASLRLEAGWKTLMSSNERRFGGSGVETSGPAPSLAIPETLLLSRNL